MFGTAKPISAVGPGDERYWGKGLRLVRALIEANRSCDMDKESGRPNIWNRHDPRSTSPFTPISGIAVPFPTVGKACLCNELEISSRK